MTLLFEKYHGIGNDFLVVEVASPDQISVEQAMALCDRHFGIGGDGVLVVSPATSERARATMTVLNADGSTPEMCGNGLRCVALHLARKANETDAEFHIDTGAGALLCEVKRDGDQGSIGTDIGLGTPTGELTHEEGGREFQFTRISTGNPHAICFQEPISEAELDILGPAVSGRIEGGANVEIATLRADGSILVGVWERGVGRTLACGTGAAATAIAAARAGKVPFDQPVEVELPGGTLEISVSEKLRAHLTGPAEWVFSGSTELKPTPKN